MAFKTQWFRDHELTLKTIAIGSVSLAIMMVVALNVVVNPSSAYAQDAAGRYAAKNSPEALRKRALARERIKQAAKAAPLWDKPLNNEMMREYRLVVSRNAIGETLQALVTTRVSERPEASLRSDGADCVSCHGKTDYLGNGVDLEGMSRQQFCNYVPGFVRNRTKPASIKNFLKRWYDFGCRQLDSNG